MDKRANRIDHPVLALLEIAQAISPLTAPGWDCQLLSFLSAHNSLSLELPFSREVDAVQYNLQADSDELVDELIETN